MKVIMLKDVDKVGDKHEVITVKNGFGRNYLLPRGLAIIGNASNMGRLNEMVRREDAQESKRLDVYKEMAQKLAGQTLKVGVKAGATGRIFGSITELSVKQQLKEQFGITIERKKIQLPEDAKEVGVYTLTLNLHPEVKQEMQLELAQD
ncbi:50S ribosomal protein L9 [Neolewinella antarctica]|uniref:Large ribosomal subunit protein bL9 n=1 Tax=Neolewinella antarctica TaxID=442734 RepID=A0ABX0XFM0_9BACT|nr:50S ribosomal protein L9 [Neolewinella antarctica]NJC28110.1 large subunit ribosomal protein L9 [Neolewinella antarctica]